MGDIPGGGMAFGPFDPNDPSAPEAVKKLIEMIHGKVEEVQDTQKMRGEARALEVRLFFEGLDDQQLGVFRALLSGLAAEGQNNYLTSIFYGMALATEWGRHPLGTAELDPGGVMSAVNTADDVMPIRPDSIDTLDDPDDDAA